MTEKETDLLLQVPKKIDDTIKKKNILYGFNKKLRKCDK